MMNQPFSEWLVNVHELNLEFNVPFMGIIKILFILWKNKPALFILVFP